MGAAMLYQMTWRMGLSAPEQHPIDRDGLSTV